MFGINSRSYLTPLTARPQARSLIPLPKARNLVPLIGGQRDRFEDDAMETLEALVEAMELRDLMEELLSRNTSAEMVALYAVVEAVVNESCKWVRTPNGLLTLQFVHGTWSMATQWSSYKCVVALLIRYIHKLVKSDTMYYRCLMHRCNTWTDLLTWAAVVRNNWSSVSGSRRTD